MAHPVVFGTGEFYDKFGAGALAVRRERLSAYHRAAFGVLLRAVCADEHFRGSAERQVGQTPYNAGLRQPCGGLHTYRGSAYAFGKA